eukprot:2018581-Prymnesium_polylepis.1
MERSRPLGAIHCSVLGRSVVATRLKSRTVILWTDGSEPGARRGTPLYAAAAATRRGAAGTHV